MKKLHTYLLLPSILLVLSSCGPVEKDQPLQTCDEQCSAQESTTLKGSFISGHLGNYEDCPDQAYTPENPKVSSNQFAGDCAQDERCGGILNCEKASTTVRLSNGGDETALGVLVQKIELKNSLGESVAILPLESVTIVDTNAQFGGKVGVDDNLSIRIDFQGPANPYQLLQTTSNTGGARQSADGVGVLHITISADNAKDITIISTPISAIPSIQT